MPESPQANDPLTEAVNTVDLPKLVAELHPESQARPGRVDVIQAVWRGDRNPSFSLYKSQTGIWMWKDFSTGHEGNAFHFLVQIEGMGKQEAAKFLMDRMGIAATAPEPQQQQSRPHQRHKAKQQPTSCGRLPLSEEELEDYEWSDAGIPASLQGRGFTAEDAITYGLRISDEKPDDALIPIFDPLGVIVAVKAKHHTGKPRYSYLHKGRHSPAWCSPNLLESRTILIVEGELNAIIAHSVLVENGESFAVMGVAGAKNHLHLSALEDKIVYIYGDNDQPGREAVDRWAEESKWAGAAAVFKLPPLEEDFCDIAGKHGRSHLHQQIKNLIDSCEQAHGPLDREIGYYTVRELYEGVNRFLNGEILIPTGFTELDAYTQGLPESGIVLVCGLPSMGKSVLMRDMVLNWLEESEDHKAMIFSPDQSVPSMLRLITSRLSNIPAWRVRANTFLPEHLDLYGSEDKARQVWQETYDYVVMEFSKRLILSEEDYLPTIKQEVEKAIDKGVTMFAGDYIQIFEMESDDGSEIDGKAIKEFKTSIRKWKVPFIFATQLAKYKFPQTRKSGVPVSTDIEGSGKIFQAAEQAYMIYNYDIYTEEYKEQEITDTSFEYAPARKGNKRSYIPKARIYVRKNKEGKRNDFRYLLWDAEVPRFRNAQDVAKVITPGGERKSPVEELALYP